MNERTVERFVGVDISKDTLDLHLVPAHAEVRSHLPYTEEAVSTLAEQLSRWEPTLVVMEATGGLETRLACELSARGIAVAVVNPRQVRSFARAHGELAKTDKLDARVLCAFGQAIRPEARPLKDVATRELSDLIGRRRQLVEMRTQEHLRLGTARSKAMKKSLTQHIAWLEKRIKEVDDDLGDRLRESPAWAAKDDLLRSAPGVGNVLSRTMLAQCPELGSLNRREIAKLVGLAPLANDSGKHKGKRRIWGGRHDVRSVLYMGALTAMRHNPAIKVFALRLKAAGKPSKVVITACMRKLLTIMNTMIKTNTAWNSEKAASAT